MSPHVLKAAQGGDRAAQAELLRALGPQLALVVRRLGFAHEKDDVLHELFVHLLAVLPRFKVDGPAKLSTWAYTVAHRFLLMRRRVKAPVLVPLEGGLSVADSALGPEAHARGAELSRRLERALGGLPDEQRRAFVLSQLHEVPLEEVARVEEVPVGTVKSRIHRARAALVLSLGAALDDEGGADARVG